MVSRSFEVCIEADMDLLLLLETTANTLAATLALLALYPEEQEWVYQSIKKHIGDRKPVCSCSSFFSQDELKHFTCSSVSMISMLSTAS